jgi:PilZ domain
MWNGKRWFAELAEVYKAEDRRHVRLPVNFAATIAGTFGTLEVTGVNAHRTGAGLQSPKALPLGALVFLRISSLGLVGFAHVRHCSLRGNGFLLGIQFRENLTRERDDSENCNRLSRSLSSSGLWDEAEG